MNRKEMIREYKERRTPMGVYRVLDTITRHSVVAASKDVTSLLNRHRAQLRVNAHPSKALQAAWNANGANSFTFEVLDLFTPPDDPQFDPIADLAVLEDMWLEKLGLAPDRLHTISRKPLAR